MFQKFKVTCLTVICKKSLNKVDSGWPGSRSGPALDHEHAWVKSSLVLVQNPTSLCCFSNVFLRREVKADWFVKKGGNSEDNILGSSFISHICAHFKGAQLKLLPLSVIWTTVFSNCKRPVVNSSVLKWTRCTVAGAKKSNSRLSHRWLTTKTHCFGGLNSKLRKIWKKNCQV